MVLGDLSDPSGSRMGLRPASMPIPTANNAALYKMKRKWFCRRGNRCWGKRRLRDLLLKGSNLPVLYVSLEEHHDPGMYVCVEDALRACR